jgi:hypothetical protein
MRWSGTPLVCRCALWAVNLRRNAGSIVGLYAEEVPMPQEAWSKKRERQYQHIKESLMADGQSEDQAEEIAARTVNKQRREEGATENKRTQGTGNPNERLEERTKDELYNRAKELEVEGRSKMSKDELITAIRDAR